MAGPSNGLGAYFIGTIISLLYLINCRKQMLATVGASAASTHYDAVVSSLKKVLVAEEDSSIGSLCSRAHQHDPPRRWNQVAPGAFKHSPCLAFRRDVIDTSLLPWGVCVFAELLRTPGQATKRPGPRLLCLVVQRPGQQGTNTTQHANRSKIPRRLLACR